MMIFCPLKPGISRRSTTSLIKRGVLRSELCDDLDGLDDPNGFDIVEFVAEHEWQRPGVLSGFIRFLVEIAEHYEEFRKLKASVRVASAVLNTGR